MEIILSVVVLLLVVSFFLHIMGIHKVKKLNTQMDNVWNKFHDEAVKLDTQMDNVWNRFFKLEEQIVNNTQSNIDEIHNVHDETMKIIDQSILGDDYKSSLRSQMENKINEIKEDTKKEVESIIDRRLDKVYKTLKNLTSDNYQYKSDK